MFSVVLFNNSVSRCTSSRKMLPEATMPLDVLLLGILNL